MSFLTTGTATESAMLATDRPTETLTAAAVAVPVTEELSVAVTVSGPAGESTVEATMRAVTVSATSLCATAPLIARAKAPPPTATEGLAAVGIALTTELSAADTATGPAAEALDDVTSAAAVVCTVFVAAAPPSAADAAMPFGDAAIATATPTEIASTSSVVPADTVKPAVEVTVEVSTVAVAESVTAFVATAIATEMPIAAPSPYAADTATPIADVVTCALSSADTVTPAPLTVLTPTSAETTLWTVVFATGTPTAPATPITPVPTPRLTAAAVAVIVTVADSDAVTETAPVAVTVDGSTLAATVSLTVVVARAAPIESETAPCPTEMLRLAAAGVAVIDAASDAETVTAPPFAVTVLSATVALTGVATVVVATAPAAAIAPAIPFGDAAIAIAIPTGVEGIGAGFAGETETAPGT